MLTVAITNESAARVSRVMFAAARHQVTIVVASLARWHFTLDEKMDLLEFAN